MYQVEHTFLSRALYKEWDSSYESLTQMVVPRSSHKIHEDSEYGLYSVTVFKKVIDEYKHHAREKKLTSHCIILEHVLTYFHLVDLSSVNLYMIHVQLLLRKMKRES